ENQGGLCLTLPRVHGATADVPRVILSPATAALYEVVGAESGRGKLCTIRLSPRGSAPADAANGRNWKFDALELKTHIESDGRISSLLTGRVLESGGTDLTVHLPA